MGDEDVLFDVISNRNTITALLDKQESVCRILHNMETKTKHVIDDFSINFSWLMKKCVIVP